MRSLGLSGCRTGIQIHPMNHLQKNGYWKATGPNKFIGRGTQVADLCRGFSKGFFPFFRGGEKKNENVGKNPWGNPLQKSATCVPLPINLFGPVAFQ